MIQYNTIQYFTNTIQHNKVLEVLEANGTFAVGPSKELTDTKPL